MLGSIGRLFETVFGSFAGLGPSSSRASSRCEAHVQVRANDEGQVEIIVLSVAESLSARVNVDREIRATVIQQPEFVHVTLPKGSRVVYEVVGNKTRGHAVINVVKLDQWIAVTVLMPRGVAWHICAEPPVVVSKQRFNRMVEADIRSEAARAGRERKKAAKQAAKQPAAQPEAPAPVGDAVEPPPSSTDAPAETPPEASGEPDAAANTGAQV